MRRRRRARCTEPSGADRRHDNRPVAELHLDVEWDARIRGVEPRRWPIGFSYLRLI
jgi:hypothetical protein